jgi:CRP-like cAMP-binding protein
MADTDPLMRKLSHGADLSEEDRRALREALRDVRQFAARSDMISEGDRPERVHVILEGFACRYKIVPDGGRQIVAYLVPGDFCDLHVAILGRMDHSIGALTKCTIGLIPHQLVDTLSASRPALTRALWWATLVDEGILREWIVSMGRRPADKQLAHLLCEMHCRLRIVGRATEDGFDFPITQADLADTLGITDVHVNRMLHQLRTSSLIQLSGKHVTIPDIAQLQHFADFDPGYLHLHRRTH